MKRNTLNRDNIYIYIYEWKYVIKN